MRSSRTAVAILWLGLASWSCSPAPSASQPSDHPASPAAATSPAPPAATGAASPLTGASPIPLPTWAQLSAPTATSVWALVASSPLYRSADSGDHWEQRSLPPQTASFQIAFIGGAEGWAAAPGPASTQCMHQSITLWHTSDGGAAWQQLPASGIAGNQCKGALSFVDPDHGFLAAWDPNNPPVIYRTGDSGRTWSPSAPLPAPPATAQPGRVDLALGGLNPISGRVFEFGPTLLMAAGAHFYSSTDGGKHWSYLATLPTLGGGGAIVSASRWLDLIGPVQSQESTDAGASWHPYSSEYSQAAPVAPEVLFGDQRVGYATVRGSIQRTVDGGAHWTPLHTPGTA